MSNRIAVINPVTPEEFVEIDQGYLDKVFPDLDITVKSIDEGPKSIESEFLEAYGLKEIVELVKKNKDEFEGFLINCFADPGVDAAREVTEKPVFGCGEPSMHLSSILGHRIGGITVRSDSHVIEDNIIKYGLKNKLTQLESIDMSVLDLDQNPEKVVEKVKEKEKKIKENGGEVLLLGCTGMATMSSDIQKEIDLPLVEPLQASMQMLNSVLELDLEHYTQKFIEEPDYSKIVG